ncbi:hypothetical protein MHPYR_180108 [uncultured Mycobacterium sp.]|uniref:Uncharacterized protein n=1 Tax=uncultured Mycobacterium sp. TaxID=171292 RepID=A0A1Y5P8Q5_9MYCO|nr:hypothetical protein MHPYR_180108 [uncultured Mycobacterium sp.]
MSTQDLTEHTPADARAWWKDDLDADEAVRRADLRAIVRAGRWLWMHAMHKRGRPEVTADELHTHNTTPGVEVFDHLVVDDEVTDLLVADLAEWSTEITATTERLVAEVYCATVGA